MRVTRMPEATRHVGPGESEGTYSVLLQHRIMGWPGPFWVGWSYYLPGGGVETETRTGYTAYIVLGGEVTVSTADGPERLGAMDSAAVEPGEECHIRNHTNAVATVMVVHSET
jgi:hypothetical protein